MKTLGEEGVFAQALTLAAAMQKLRWASDNGEFSAMIRPDECDALLERIEQLEDNARNWRELAAIGDSLA